MKKVKRVYKENKEVEIITIQDAIHSLDGYWIKTDIERLLMSSQVLSTPYADYSIVENNDDGDYVQAQEDAIFDNFCHNNNI
jgi:hypothetical protein